MISPEQRADLQEAVYLALYHQGLVFDRDSVVPAVVDAVLEHTPAYALLAAAADVDELDHIAGTPMKDVTDEDWCRFAHSPLAGHPTRVDFARYLRDRASRTND